MDLSSKMVTKIGKGKFDPLSIKFLWCLGLPQNNIGKGKEVTTKSECIFSNKLLPSFVAKLEDYKLR